MAKKTAKMDAALEKRLKAMGIKAKSEDEAREKLLKMLEKEGIEGMEEEDTDTLIDMVDSFTENEPEVEEDDDTEVEETEDETSEDDEDEDVENLADEVEAEDAEDNDTEEDDEEETEDEPEVEEEKKPAKKVAAKPAKKEAAPKKEKAEKKEKPAKEKKPSKRGTKLNPKANEADRKAFQPLMDLFGEDYAYDWVSTYGVNVKYNGKNGKRAVCLFENATVKEDGTITGNLYLQSMTKQTEVLDEQGIDYELCWTKAPMIKGITLDDAIEIIQKVFEIMTGFATTMDKRLGDNRKKMEESLQKSGKKAAEKKADVKTKKAAPVEDDDEEDDEVEDEAPAKPVKKAVKKAKK